MASTIIETRYIEHRLLEYVRTYKFVGQIMCVCLRAYRHLIVGIQSAIARRRTSCAGTELVRLRFILKISILVSRASLVSIRTQAVCICIHTMAVKTPNSILTVIS